MEETTTDRTETTDLYQEEVGANIEPEQGHAAQLNFDRPGPSSYPAEVAERKDTTIKEEGRTENKKKSKFAKRAEQDRLRANLEEQRQVPLSTSTSDENLPV